MPLTPIFPNPEPGHDLVLLDTRKTEGGGDWSGHFIGAIPGFFLTAET